MGQAKRRGTYEQRRQAAIARMNPCASSKELNTYYKHEPHYRRKPHLALAMMASLFVGLPASK